MKHIVPLHVTCWAIGTLLISNIFLIIVKGSCCDHFYTTLTDLKLVEIFISSERPYFSHQHTEI